MKKLFLILLLLYFQAFASFSKTYLVQNQDEFSSAVSSVIPGDSIVLANKIWKDAKLILNCKGTLAMPITLCAEKNGKVLLEGQSFLELGGEFIVVSGLVFQNGFTPHQNVISFKSGLSNLAQNCRVTNCVIDSYNPNQRDKADHWVALSGKSNRFDHNMLINKLNEGPVLIVRLEEEGSRENNHLIDHNYFSRPKRLGSNGGETIRIGTSTYSMSASNTMVEGNYFDRCCGEVEIVSNKSCGNVYKGNVFFECEGSMVLRHGNGCTVEGNFFIGNNKEFTGGVRVIGENHKVINNYFYKCMGKSFRAPLSLMNGVPNSPLIRYFQVKNALIAHNTWIDCAPLEFGAGVSAERSLPPSTTNFINNIIWKTTNEPSILALDKTDGISFKDNLYNSTLGIDAKTGFSLVSAPIFEALPNVFYPQIKPSKISEVEAIVTDIFGQSRKKKNFAGCLVLNEQILAYLVHAECVKLIWYDQSNSALQNPPKTVKPGLNTLLQAIQDAQPNDTLYLSPGEYQFAETIYITQNQTIIGLKENGSIPVFHSIGPEVVEFFVLENNGSLNFSNINFEGAGNNGIVRYAIRTNTSGMIKAYNLKFEDCKFLNFTKDAKTSLVKAYRGSYADSIVFRGCTVENVVGTAIDLSAEIEDIGKYNTEYLIIDKCSFKNIAQNVLNLYRGGTDESTLGPLMKIQNSSFENIGSFDKNEILNLTGVQYVDINNSTFQNCPKITTSFRLKGANNKISNCKITNAGKPILTDGAKMEETTVK